MRSSPGAGPPAPRPRWRSPGRAVACSSWSKPPAGPLGRAKPWRRLPGPCSATSGLLDRLAAGGHLPCYGNLAVWGADEPQAADFLFNPYGHGWHVDRARFDAMLREATVAAGAVLRQSVDCPGPSDPRAVAGSCGPIGGWAAGRTWAAPGWSTPRAVARRSPAGLGATRRRDDRAGGPARPVPAGTRRARRRRFADDHRGDARRLVVLGARALGRAGGGLPHRRRPGGAATRDDRGVPSSGSARPGTSGVASTAMGIGSGRPRGAAAGGSRLGPVRG